MIKANMHIHSKYSWDSKMELEDIASILLKNEITYAGIADHIEFDKETLPGVLIKLKIRNLEIDKINMKYQGKIILLKGVEVSEPYLYKDNVNALNEINLDYIIGSVHKINKNKKNTLEQRTEIYNYYKNILRIIKECDVDIIGHLDYINRYCDGDYTDFNQISEVINCIKEKNKILEINTSANRKLNNQEFFPSIDKLKIYSKWKNEVILGTDAHKIDELLYGLDRKTEYILKILDLKQIIYKKRKKEII